MKSKGMLPNVSTLGALSEDCESGIKLHGDDKKSDFSVYLKYFCVGRLV